ncbi:uncharacterized protein LOC115883457 [Sitophilus oryzae]|uniref:Uncharacterized protein LOC115883457 n=1 Tax=Sitophilus oryzae TaxID=7048 RepID=A0A6J2Y336_SITOR|nr:uncharacterized protein LOC115883457 [Sitophilus oryzae]
MDMEDTEFMGDIEMSEFTKYSNFLKSDHVLESVLKNEVEDLILNEELIKWGFNKFNGQNIISIACSTSEVTEQTLEILLKYVFDNFSDIDLRNEDWYYWEPIHYAARNADYNKLITILNSPYKKRINILSVFSENALHVLLKYRKKSKSFNVDLALNRWEKKTCRVISEEKDNLLNCAEALINAGIDVNHKNIWCESPIIIALRYRFLKVLNLLQRQPNIDIDSCKDLALNKTARDIMKEYDIDLNGILFSSAVFNDPINLLFTLLKSNSEDKFLLYNNKDIREYSNAFDGKDGVTTSGNLLQLCLVKGFIAYQKEIRKEHSTDFNKDIMKTQMLDVFCRKGMVKSLEHLLDNNASVKQRHRMFQKLNTFDLAIKLRYYPFLVMIFQHRSNQIRPCDILNKLKLVHNTNNPNDYYFRHVLFLLLSKLDTFYYNTDDTFYDNVKILDNVVDFCIKNNKNNMYDEVIYLALRLGAHLCYRKNSGAGVKLELLCSEILSNHLDQCIDAHNNICYNSIIFDDENHYSEVDVIRRLYHSNKTSELLNHPVLINLIHEKWSKSKYVFYSNCILHCIFLVVLYVYMIYLKINAVPQIVLYVFWVFVTFFSLVELCEICIYSFRYFSDPMNYIDLSVLPCSIYNIYSKDERVMVIAILLYTIKVLLIFGQIPIFTKYMIIFSSTKYFFEYVLFYFVQFFSFALCFFILLTPESEFNVLGQIFVKLFESLFFFIGQYDGEISHPINFPIFSRIIITLFIFCMTLILNNLLVGLIVTDMDILKKRSKLMRQLKMAKYVVRVEKLMNTLPYLASLSLDISLFHRREEKCLYLSMDILDEDDKEYLNNIDRSKKSSASILAALHGFIRKQDDVPKHKQKTNESLEELSSCETIDPIESNEFYLQLYLRSPTPQSSRRCSSLMYNQYHPI